MNLAVHQVRAVGIGWQLYQTASCLTHLNGIVAGNVFMHIAHRQLRIGTLQPEGVALKRHLQNDVVQLPHAGKVFQQSTVGGADCDIVRGDSHLFQHSSHIVRQTLAVAKAALADLGSRGRLLTSNAQEDSHIAGSLFKSLIECLNLLTICLQTICQLVQFLAHGIRKHLASINQAILPFAIFTPVFQASLSTIVYKVGWCETGHRQAFTKRTGIGFVFQCRQIVELKAEPL